MHPYSEYINPELGKLLSKIGLDKRYTKGEGCYLYDQDGKQYLDAIAAYGALPFGFNPPDIWLAINQVQGKQEPSFTQPSLLEAAGELARSLISIAPSAMKSVTFTNSGAEAVEAAIKLARAKTGKKGIVSAYNSFHGKTLGALSATGNRSYQTAFGAPVEGFFFITYGDIDELQALLMQKADQIAAVILEPIQGEGGIIEPPTDYLTKTRDICAKYDVLLILDEIQTGLGRTGDLFACQRENVSPDVMVLAKALGGGLIPIGAVMCTEDVYTEEFGLKHSSTFAGNAIACRVGCKVVELLIRNDYAMVNSIASKGARLRQGLLDIKNKYPQVIREIRGRGLMLGIDFGSSREPYPDSMLGIMAEQNILAPVIAGYLLNEHKLRVAPTLNGASVIRIEPPLIISEDQIELILNAVEHAANMLTRRHTAVFFSHLIKSKVPTDINIPKIIRPQVKPVSAKNEGRFAFLIHPLDPSTYADFDQSLQVFSPVQLQKLSNNWRDMVEPFVVAGTRVTSDIGKHAYGDFIVVPYTAHDLQNMPKQKAEAVIVSAIDLAVERGARIVGLGAYTSVITAGGRSLVGKVEVPLTTGNGFTVVSGVDALIESGLQLGVELEKATAAVVGAGGAIGKASALILSEQVSHLILIGNPARADKSVYRMLKVMAEMYRYLTSKAKNGYSFKKGSIGAYVNSLNNKPAVTNSLKSWIDFVNHEIVNRSCPIDMTVDINDNLPMADLILTATSSTEALITPSMLKPGALICDMSRPSNVSKKVLTERTDVLVIDGGVIEVPGKPDLGWYFGFDKGLAYACMSETMMLALEKKYENTSIGADLDINHLNQIKNLARIHGFKLAGLRSFDLPLSDKVWQRVAKARTQVC